ncbi:MarR family transcriptional regulator [Sphingobacterium sp. SRCM116780]|uniref:MarR family winged helix-turn-helix transcriptional regulator n=1 Tax=Sphingobacterium sp. SRCM116780 TaxID=2907623 RepID=UPI001F411E8D|nr:MarR family transcriptional regulator [Sphingobacterium sp. SRCM116780]UIR58047.1 MarR family transcriptional regulator [Sphingobacterium sp. SRCM116780]
MLNEDLIGKVEFYDFLTGKATTAISRRMQRNLKDVGINITAEQWSILYNLWQEEGLTQQELATRTFRDKPSITRLINNLEKLNLVIRVNDKEDRRSNLIYLTKAARKLKEMGMQQANKTIAEALDGVCSESIDMAQLTLQQVICNLRK